MVTKNIEKQDVINALGEFKDTKIEKQYFNNYMSNSTNFIFHLFTAYTAGFLIYIVINLFLISTADFKQVTPFLLLMAIVTVFTAFASQRIKEYRKLNSVLNFYAILTFLLYMLLTACLDNYNFAVNNAVIMIFFIGIAMIPGRWLNTLIVSMIIFGITVLATGCFFAKVSTLIFLEATSYLLLLMILVFIASYKMQITNRLQFYRQLQLEQLSISDKLTGAYNRLYFDMILEKWCSMAKRYKSPFAVIIMDIDKFKDFNDTYGHIAGDKVLIECSLLANKVKRDTDTFARWGGEEFVFLLPETNGEQARGFAERLRLEVSSHDFGPVGNVFISAGVSEFIAAEDDALSLMRRVDTLLYKAKNEGRNRVELG